MASTLWFSTGCGGDDATGSGGNGGDGAGGTVATGGGGASNEAGAQLTCPPGELSDGDGACLAPGIAETECGQGFTHDGDVGCQPILPSSPCVAGELATVGDTSCHLLTACSSPETPPTDGTTQYVNASFGGNSDGSASAPWTNVQAAVNAAASGAVIAIAPGSYAGGVNIDKPVRLWGACAEGVSLTSGIVLQGNADASELHALSLTASQAGLSINGASGVLLDRVRVHDTGWIPIEVRDNVGGEASVTIEDSLIENGGSVGIYASGSSVTLRRSEVRQIQPQGGDFGYGLSGETNASTGRRTSFTIEQSHVHDLRTAGIIGWGVTVRIEDSVVSDVAPRPFDSLFGYAVGVERQASTGERSDLTIVGSVIERANFCGVCMWDSELTMERTVVRDVVSQVGDGDFGWGVRTLDIALDEPLRPTMHIESSLIERVQQMGVGIFGADVTIRQIVVRDVTGRTKDGKFGHLISAQSTWETEVGSHLDLRGARLERGSEVGLAALGATMDLEGVSVSDITTRPDGLFGAPVAYGHDIIREIPSGGTVSNLMVDGGYTGGFVVLGADVVASDVIVRNIQPDLFSQQFGDGIIASSFIFSPTLYDTALALDRVTVEGAPRAGIAAFSSAVSVGSSDLDCNVIALDAEAVLDGEATLEDGGGNRCRCETDEEACKVLQSGLEPPTPPI
jgi:Right handed beta helix region